MISEQKLYLNNGIVLTPHDNENCFSWTKRIGWDHGELYYRSFHRVRLSQKWKQWWMLGEANEAVASGAPLKIAHIVSVSCRCFLEIIMNWGRKAGNTRAIRGEDLFF